MSTIPSPRHWREHTIFQGYCREGFNSKRSEPPLNLPICGVTRSCQERRDVLYFCSCGNSSAIERFLAKEEVAGLIPVFRSIKTHSAMGVFCALCSEFFIKLVHLRTRFWSVLRFLLVRNN